MILLGGWILEVGGLKGHREVRESRAHGPQNPSMASPEDEDERMTKLETGRTTVTATTGPPTDRDGNDWASDLESSREAPSRARRATVAAPLSPPARCSGVRARHLRRV